MSGGRRPAISESVFRRSCLPLLTVLLLAAPAPAGAQVVLHLTFDQPEALGADSSGNNHAAPFISGVPTATASGVSGGAVEFDGQTYLRWGSDIAATLAGSFTAAVWIKTTQSYGYDYEAGYYGVGIVYADQPGQTTDTIPIALNGSKAGFMTSNGVQDTTIHSTSAINTGSFVHVAVTYDIATGVKRLYVNGTLQATETVTPTALNARNLLFLGANDFDGRYFTGVLDDFQFYNQALTADEVSFAFNHPGQVAVPEPSTVALLALGAALLVIRHRRRRA